jgi:hypothetical protein
VLVEADVLDCDDRVLHDLRDRRERDDDAVLVVEAGDLLAVGRDDRGHLRKRLLLEVRRQALEVVARRARGDADTAHERKEDARHQHARNDAHDQQGPEAARHRAAHSVRVRREPWPFGLNHTIIWD